MQRAAIFLMIVTMLCPTAGMALPTCTYTDIAGCDHVIAYHDDVVDGYYIFCEGEEPFGAGGRGGLYGGCPS